MRLSTCTAVLCDPTHNQWLLCSSQRRRQGGTFCTRLWSLGPAWEQEKDATVMVASGAKLGAELCLRRIPGLFQPSTVPSITWPMEAPSPRHAHTHTHHHSGQVSVSSPLFFSDPSSKAAQGLSPEAPAWPPFPERGPTLCSRLQALAVSLKNLEPGCTGTLLPMDSGDGWPVC